MKSTVYNVESNSSHIDQGNYLETYHDYLVMVDVSNDNQQDEARGTFLASMVNQLSSSWVPGK